MIVPRNLWDCLYRRFAGATQTPAEQEKVGGYVKASELLQDTLTGFR